MLDLWIVIHLVATVFMTGVIWFVQVVHYPLFAKVGQRGFAAYEASHTTRTTWVVGPAMLTEMATAILIWLSADETTLPAIGLGMLAVIWVSTAIGQVPEHRRLAAGLDLRALARINPGCRAHSSDIVGPLSARVGLARRL